MSEIISMIPNREFKLSELSKINSSASEINRLFEKDYFGLSQIGFVSDQSITGLSWNQNNNVSVINKHFKFKKFGTIGLASQTKTTISSPVVSGTKYIALINLENIIIKHPTVAQLLINNYNQVVATIQLSEFISTGRKIIATTFTSSEKNNLLQVIVGPTSTIATDLEADTELLEFDSNFIGFIPWTQEAETYWYSIADSYKYPNFNNYLAPRALIANKALSTELPTGSFDVITSLANREANKVDTNIIRYNSTSNTTATNVIESGIFKTAVSGNASVSNTRGWFGFDIKPNNYATEDKKYIIVVVGKAKATNITNMYVTSAFGYAKHFTDGMVDGEEQSFKIMLEVPYTAGESTNKRYIYTSYTVRDSVTIKNFNFECEFTTYAVFEKVSGFSIDDYIAANKEALIIPKYFPSTIATLSTVDAKLSAFVKNSYTLSGNDFDKKYDNEMFLSGGQSLNVGGGASNNSTEFKNTLAFTGGDCVYPFDLTTQPLRDAFFGTSLLPIKTTTAKYPPISASIVTMLNLLEDENRVNVSAFGGAFIPFAWGVSGNSIITMEKGTDSYNIMIEAITKAKLFSNKTGKTFGVTAMNWYHGEADGGQSKEWYYTKLSQLFINVNTDVKAITGQTEDVQFFTYQTSAWMPRLQPHINIQEAQLQVANDYNNVHMCGAMYQFAYNDLFHPSDRATIGLQTGVAMKRVLYDAKEWVTFKPISHKIITDGTNYYTHLKFDVPVKPMRFDISGDAWHNPRGKEINYGFKLLSGGVEKQTAEPFIVRGDTVVLTSTTNPIGMTIQYAVNGHEGGGNLCDSQNIIVPNKEINYVIDNFAVSFSTYIID